MLNSFVERNKFYTALLKDIYSYLFNMYKDEEKNISFRALEALLDDEYEFTLNTFISKIKTDHQSIKNNNIDIILGIKKLFTSVIDLKTFSYDDNKHTGVYPTSLVSFIKVIFQPNLEMHYYENDLNLTHKRNSDENSYLPVTFINLLISGGNDLYIGKLPYKKHCEEMFEYKHSGEDYNKVKYKNLNLYIGSSYYNNARPKYELFYNFKDFTEVDFVTDSYTSLYIIYR